MFFLALLLLGGPVSAANAVRVASPGTLYRPRSLQIGQTLDTNNFRASYMARFQHLVDPACNGPNPTIQVFCYGEIKPVSTSDGSITCSQVSNGEWSGLQCVNTCGSGASGSPPCSQVFLEQADVGDGNFGEIVFHCEGEEAADVDAHMKFLGGESGNCTAGSLSSRNFHVAQLGVYCPGNGYMFSGKKFECGLGSDTAKIEGIYTCLEGSNCEGSACEVKFEDLIIDADRQNFHECIESLTGVEVPEEPLKEDLIAPAAPGNYSATFRANWQLRLDPRVCGGDFAKKRLSCTNGKIEMMEAMADNVNCAKIDDSSLECEDTSAEHFVNNFSGVVFQCNSVDKIPEVEAVYYSADSICVSETENPVEHLIQLGVTCEDTTNGRFTSYADHLFECGDDNAYEIIDQRYTCAQQNFLKNKETKPLGNTTVHTDFRWSRGAYNICYALTPDGPTVSPTPCAGASGIGIGVGSGGDCATMPNPTSIPTTPGPTTMTPATPGPTPEPTTMPPTEPTCPEVAGGAACTTEIAPVTCGSLDCQYDNQCWAEWAGFKSTQCTSIGTPPPTDTYYADYRARFKRVVDPGCVSPTYETLIIVCTKGELVDVETNSDFVRCSAARDYQGTGELSLCEVDCTGTECDELYIDRESLFLFGIWILNENHVEIIFRCQSDDVNGVDAAYLISGSEDSGLEGSCDGAGQGDGQNVLLSQLNIECPTSTGGMAYVNDDAYSECYGGLSLDINGNYTCLTGQFCGGDEECLVTYDDLEVQADHHRFRECIHTESGFPAPVPEPLTEVPEEGQYTAQFQVGSEFWYNDDACSGAKTGLRITCVDGTIELISSDPDKECQLVSNNEIECTETQFGVVNEAVDVAVYECTGINTVPATRVEYSATDVACDSSSREQATRYINLGVKCGDPGDESYVSDDYFFECGKNNDYTSRTDDFRFTCYSRVQVPENSNNVAVVIPPVEAYTDYRFIFLASERCYSYKAPTLATSRSSLLGSSMRDITKAKKTAGSASSSSSDSIGSGKSGIASTSAASFDSFDFGFGVGLAALLISLIIS